MLATSARMATDRCLATHPRSHAATLPGAGSDSMGTREYRLGQHAVPPRRTAYRPQSHRPRQARCKHHLLVDQRGLSLVRSISGAQVHDSRMLIPLLEAAPSVSGLAGRPCKRPSKLHADKAYASRAHRAWLRSRGIAPRIARYGIESRERLGKWRWVVERTLGWLHRFCRLRIRYERRADIHQAFLSLAGILICWRYIQRFC